MVTIYTASLTFNNSTFCPHSVFMCFVWISEQTAIISLYSINWLVFVTEMKCVYCAVRTESLYKIQVDFSLSISTMGLFLYCYISFKRWKILCDILKYRRKRELTPETWWENVWKFRHAKGWDSFVCNGKPADIIVEKLAVVGGGYNMLRTASNGGFWCWPLTILR